MLLAFLGSKLPSLDSWMRENHIDASTFCRFVPTGLLFLGSARRLFVEESAPDETHAFFWPCPSKEARARWAQERGEPIPKFMEVEPYFGWASRVLKRDRYFREDDSNRTRTDSFMFGAWRSERGVSTAYLFRTFPLLKLGSLTVASFGNMGRRNLDLADLDGLAIEGHPSNYAISIHYSTLRHLQIRNALVHHTTLYACELEGLMVDNSELQSVTLDNCSAIGFGTRGPRVARSTIRGLRILGRNFVPDFDDSDLLNVEYLPNSSLDATRAADNFRKLRAAYQSCARRREAARMYYFERVYERKALADPYLDRRAEFPPMGFAGRFRDGLRQWYKREQPASHVRTVALQILWFKIRVWLIPKYCWRAVSFKFQYLLSLFESALWGYGERPGRVFLFAATAVSAFTAVYFMHPNHLTHFPLSGNIIDRLLNSAYFSIVTFTTLGYGDILPADNVMKTVCAAEALTGAFTMGMVVAGFANRGRY